MYSKEKRYWLEESFKQFGYKFTSVKLTLDEFLDILSEEDYNLISMSGMSKSGITKLIKRTFPDRTLKSRKICAWLLAKIDKKYCRICKHVLDREKFHSNTSKADNKGTYCIVCNQQTKNPNISRQATAKHKAAKIQAIPLWLSKGQLEEIKNIYHECPKGFHVDHIIPLQGNNVCGLHVPWNLQYLSSIDNMKKGNRI